MGSIHRAAPRHVPPDVLLQSAQQSHLDRKPSETDKPEHDLDIPLPPLNSQLSSLFPRYISTLSEIEDVASDLAFVSFRTEPVPHCYKTAEVCLDFLPRLGYIFPGAKRFRTGERGGHDQSVEAASFKINGRHHAANNESSLLTPQGASHLPAPRPGTDIFVDIDELETVLINRIEKFRQVVPGKQLILVGNALHGDFERLRLEFPGISRLFWGRIDVSDLLEAKALVARSPDSYSKPTHASSNADQCQPPKIEIAARVADLETKPYRALLRVKGSRPKLPPSINSAEKLALALQYFNPVAVAIDSKCHCRSVRRRRIVFSLVKALRRRTRGCGYGCVCGCVCFADEKTLYAFIHAVDLVVVNGMILNISQGAPSPRAQRAMMRNGKVDVDLSECLKRLYLVESERGDGDGEMEGLEGRDGLDGRDGEDKGGRPRSKSSRFTEDLSDDRDADRDAESQMQPSRQPAPRQPIHVKKVRSVRRLARRATKSLGKRLQR
ncbi:hypothetical protein GGR50DRAFT_80982 [Xylaria sp. CBS 124048]|nr:hypothetical protein GGR50DRAFT_80982 [Xylaria sp. CBS 124048]